jgi:nitrogen regulatory protein P-II 2
MHTHSLALVTIVAEPMLERRLTDDIRALGASGFTVTEGRGEGTRALHAGEIPGTVVRIETIVAHATADAILRHLAARYFADHSIIVYRAEVAVLRGEKYVGVGAGSAAGRGGAHVG